MLKLQTAPAPNVDFFIACLVDFIWPGVVFVTVKDLTEAGPKAEIRGNKKCCGQLTHNYGVAINATGVCGSRFANIIMVDEV
jgi:Fe-S oxidoreductase